MIRTSALALAIALALPAFAQLDEADRQWERRADGNQGARAAAAPIDSTIAALRRAASADPGSLEARWKLLRALRFKGAYVAVSNDAKKAVYEEARKAGEEAMAVVQRLLSAKGVKAGAPEAAVAHAARSIPGAGEIIYWDAVNWGEWALAYGKMAAVKKGAADRIRRQATIAMLIDPRLERGGGARVLGRLHNQTPRVPFVTGWASDAEAVKFLRQALDQDPSDKLTRVFLAEAMVAVDGKRKPEAKKMLSEVIAAPIDERFEVEEIAAQNDARALLARL